MTRLTGIHHLAIQTADMKGQLEFFCDVLGARLVGLFWMHGVEGAWHAFCHLDDHCSFSLVELPANREIEPIPGVTHSGTGDAPSAPGTMQHLAFQVETLDDLLAMRDRIRSRGVNVMGPLDHGMCHSMYFAGPEGLTLEIATSDTAIDPDVWVDLEVAELAGLSADDLARFRDPDEFVPGDQPIAQPPIDPAKPHMAYPPDQYERMIMAPDHLVTEHGSHPDPPSESVAARAARAADTPAAS